MTIPHRLHTDLGPLLESARRDRWRGARWFVLAALLAGAAMLVKRAVDERATSTRTQWVQEPVRLADVRVTVAATGKLQGLNTVEVGAEVSGKVLRVLVDYNQKVHTGQLLAEIDPERLLAAVEQARAQLLVTKANVRTAEATLTEARLSVARAEEQAENGLLAQKDLEAARATSARAASNLAGAEASAAQAAAALKSHTSLLEKSKITAPSDGMVLARYVEPGQTVTAGYTTPVLFKLAEDLSNLSLLVEINEADIGLVREGNAASFTVDAYSKRTFASKVMSLRNDPKTTQGIVTYEAVLSVDNPERLLRPGMTATATITSAVVPGARVVPNAALRFVPPAQPQDANAPAPRDRKRVYVLRGDQPTAVLVRTGATDGYLTELLSNEVNVGERVITDVVPGSQ